MKVTFRNRRTGAEHTIAPTPEARANFFRTRDPRDWQEIQRGTPEAEPRAADALRPGMTMERGDD